MKSKRILVIDQGEIWGGAEAYIMDVMEYMKGHSFPKFFLLHDKNAHPQYLERLKTIPHVQHAPISLPSLTLSSFKSWLVAGKSMLSILLHIFRFKPHLILSNTVRGHTLSAPMAFLTRTPAIWLIHDFTFPGNMLRELGGIPKKLICVSETVRNYILKEYPRAVNKAIVIPNGVGPVPKHLTVPPMKDKDGVSFSFDPKQRYVGIIGRIDIWKGQDIFLEAARILKEEYSTYEDLQFLIFGSPTLTSEERKTYFSGLIEYKKKHHLSHVHFLGYQDKYMILSHLNILIHASTEPEPFGRTIIEAFAMSTPVIAANIGAPCEIIEYGRNGLLFEAGNPRDLAQKIAMLLEDKQLQNTLILGGKRDLSDLYRMEVVLDKLLEEFRKTTK